MDKIRLIMEIIAVAKLLLETAAKYVADEVTGDDVRRIAREHLERIAADRAAVDKAAEEKFGG